MKPFFSYSFSAQQILESILVVGALFSFLYVPSLSNFSTYSSVSITTVVALPLSAGSIMMESSFWRSLVTLCRQLDKLLGGGFADCRVPLTPDLSLLATSVKSCWAVASVAAMMSGTGMALGG